VRLSVLGAGAIGAYVGASLARAEAAEVTLIARGAHLEAMREHGVQVLSPRGDFLARPAVTGELESIETAEVVFVALKAYGLPAVAPRLGKLLAPGTAVIWAQNGIPWWYFQSHTGPLAGRVVESVDPGGVISAAIAPRHNIGCVLYCAAEIVRPGVIRHIEGTRFAIGEPDGTVSERCRRISHTFASGGLKAPVESRLRDHIWLKLVGNVAFNPVSALTGATLGELAERVEVVELLRSIFAECASVSDRLGVSFPVSLEKRLAAGLAVGDHKTSMLQDLEAGKPLELGCLTGAVIELGGVVGVDVPCVKAVHACTSLLEDLSRRRATAAEHRAFVTASPRGGRPVTS
jgi:2-dehydropantoate 2-reductase